MSPRAAAAVVFLAAALWLLPSVALAAGGTRPLPAPPAGSRAEAQTPGPSLPPAGSRAEAQTPGPSLPPVPPAAPTPGERDPLAGVLAVVAIVVAAGAGLWIYRVIRKGL